MIVTARLQARLHPHQLAARISRVPITAAMGTGLRATLDPLSVDIPLPLAATPVFAPGAGSFYLPQLITLSSATPSAAIYYTTNGTEPTEASPLYTAPFTLPSGTYTLKARAYAPGYSPSEVASAAYELLPAKLPAPFIDISTDDPITPSSTHYFIIRHIGAIIAIYFTTDGSEPTEASTLYTGPFALPAGTYTIKARAYAPGYSPSDVAVSEEFTVQQSLPTEGGILHNGYIYHIFEADGELAVLANVDVDVMLVGGGGGNGGTYNNWGTGGGGAGAVIEDNISLTPGTYDVNIGLGGESLNNGGNTAAFGLTAIGGGCGGKRTDIAPNDGGSGGGAPSWYKYLTQPFFSGGAPQAGQGHKGGDGDVSGTASHQGSQGGGGYGSQGVDRLTARAAGIHNNAGTNGGLGKLLSDIFNGLESGESIGLDFDGVAGGGGGAAGATSTTIGLGGGVAANPYGAGNGGHGTLSPTPTIDGTGSGAGGAAATMNTIEGRSCGRGGDGIVIVRYAA